MCLSNLPLKLLIALLCCLKPTLAQDTSYADGEMRIRTAYVEFRQQGLVHKSIAEIQVEIGDGNLLLLTPDGQLHTLEKKDIISVEPTEEVMIPLTSEQIYEQLRAELPANFDIYKTRHFLLVHNTTKIYAEWVGRLFEDLYRRFYNYWGNARGEELAEPRFPLVALVFSDKASYLRFAQDEIGQAAQSMIGYYNLKTNRIITYDMTGVDGLVPPGRRVSSSQVITQILRQPQAERTVSTIIHEAVHQLAYNSGLQVRLADTPTCVSEGMAMFFEAPDRNSRVGWGALGKVNYYNLNLFLKNLPSRKPNSLAELIGDDTQFQSASTAGIAYPESWALTYFLIKVHREKYVSYLAELSELVPLSELSPRERMEMFSKHFGDVQELERNFLKYVQYRVH